MHCKIFLFITFIIPTSLFAQKQPRVKEDLSNLDSLTQAAQLIFTDTLVDKPNTAALYSAMLPGLGQMYNNKPWKVPIIYGGFMLFGYIIKYNNDAFQESRAALFAERDGDPRTEPKPPLDLVSVDVLERRNDYFRRNRDFTIILTIAWYLLNIVDAHVDGHLNEFVITDDLSLNIGSPTEPLIYSTFNSNVTNYGLSLTFTF